MAAGAGLDELLRWENGEYPEWFQARVIAWHQLHEQVRMHREAAAQGKPKKGK